VLRSSQSLRSKVPAFFAGARQANAVSCDGTCYVFSRRRLDCVLFCGLVVLPSLLVRLVSLLRAW